MNISYKNIKRWYLEMDKPFTNIPLKYPSNTSIKEFTGVVDEYRRLNRLIGEDLGWVDRQIMSDSDLKSLIQNKDIKIYVLYDNNVAIGYTEIDLRHEGTAILEYFGLAPGSRGKGLGKFLLQWTINEVAKYPAQKFKLHTSDQDHPGALPNYLKSGFRIVDEKIEKQAVIINK